ASDPGHPFPCQKLGNSSINRPVMPQKKGSGSAVEPAVRWREWLNLRANMSWIYEGCVLPQHQRGNFSPDHMGDWLIQRGRAELQQADKTVRAEAGEWLIPWPGYRYQEFSSDAVILSVRFRAAWPDNKPLFDRGLSIKFAASDHPRLERLARETLRSARSVIPDDPVELAREAVPFERYITVN